MQGMPQAQTPTPQAQHTRRFVPTQLREASIAPATFNEASRTVDVVWTTGARVRRYDWWTDRSDEKELVVSEDAIDMQRLNAGAPVLNTHRSARLDDQIGVVERAWFDGGVGMATIRLSEREDVAGIVADIKAGVIRNISVGYNVTTYEVTGGRNRTDGSTLDRARRPQSPSGARCRSHGTSPTRPRFEAPPRPYRWLAWA